MRKIAIFAAAAALAVSMAGCSSVSLDREIDIADGIAMKVPSSWVEDRNDYDIGDNHSGSAFFAPGENKTGMLVSWDVGGEPELPEESMRKTASNYNDMGSTDWEQELIEERVVSGAECSVYRYSYTSSPTNDGSTLDFTHYIALIRGGDIELDIDTFDDRNLLNAVLDTVTIP
mgnify:CR=1 FL=1